MVLLTYLLFIPRVLRCTTRDHHTYGVGLLAYYYLSQECCVVQWGTVKFLVAVGKSHFGVSRNCTSGNIRCNWILWFLSELLDMERALKIQEISFIVIFTLIYIDEIDLMVLRNADLKPTVLAVTRTRKLVSKILQLKCWFCSYVN